jgi:hypothetical protein
MRDNLRYLAPLVEQILRNPDAQPTGWSVQGFGMLRTYFGPAHDPKRFRLNLWDSRFAVPGVSTIHDHPWHFKSVIVAGAFCNVRYNIYPTVQHDGETHAYSTIKTGVDSNLDHSPTKYAMLAPRRPELYKAGDEYNQDADEIHETIYSDGCVTLNERTRVGDGEHARVFWPADTDWVDAKPRSATPAEVKAATSSCLAEWFDVH